MIAKLKDRIKKVAVENDRLKKIEMAKHQKLVSAERKIVEMEQEEEMPIPKEEELLN